MPKRITTKEKEHLQDLKNNIKMLKDELTDFQRKLFEKYGRNY